MPRGRRSVRSPRSLSLSHYPRKHTEDVLAAVYKASVLRFTKDSDEPSEPQGVSYTDVKRQLRDWKVLGKSDTPLTRELKHLESEGLIVVKDPRGKRKKYFTTHGFFGARFQLENLQTLRSYRPEEVQKHQGMTVYGVKAPAAEATIFPLFSKELETLRAIHRKAEERHKKRLHIVISPYNSSPQGSTMGYFDHQKKEWVT